VIYFLSLVLFCIPWVLPNGNFELAVELFLMGFTGLVIFKNGIRRSFVPLIMFFLAYVPFISYPVDVLFIQLRSLIFPLLMVSSLSKLRVASYSIFQNFFLWFFVAVVFIAIYEGVTGTYFLNATNRYGQELVGLGAMHRSYSLIGNAIDLAHFIVLGAIYILPKVKWKSLFVLLVIIALATTRSRGPMISVLFGLVVSGFVPQLLKTRPKLFLLFGVVLLLISSMFVDRLAQLNQRELLQDPYRFSWLLASLNIIRDNILLGSGPGTFGGWVSINYFVSPIYHLYNVDTYGISSIDMFWPHLVAELGLLGTMAYLVIFYRKGNTMIKHIAIAYCLMASLFSIALESQLVLFLLALIIYEPKKDNTDFIHDGSVKR